MTKPSEENKSLSEGAQQVRIADDDWVDTPLLQAKRRAFDHPTQSNLDALIQAAQAERIVQLEAERDGYANALAESMCRTAKLVQATRALDATQTYVRSVREAAEAYVAALSASPHEDST